MFRKKTQQDNNGDKDFATRVCDPSDSLVLSSFNLLCTLNMGHAKTYASTFWEQAAFLQFACASNHQTFALLYLELYN